MPQHTPPLTALEPVSPRHVMVINSDAAASGGVIERSWRRVPRLYLFKTLVVRDKIDPDKVHEAFMRIEEYREASMTHLQTDVRQCEPRLPARSRRRTQTGRGE